MIACTRGVMLARQIRRSRPWVVLSLFIINAVKPVGIEDLPVTQDQLKCLRVLLSEARSLAVAAAGRERAKSTGREDAVGFSCRSPTSAPLIRLICKLFGREIFNRPVKCFVNLLPNNLAKPTPLFHNQDIDLATELEDAHVL